MRALSQTSWGVLGLMLILMFGQPSTGWAAPVTYTIDPVHSNIGFTIRHMMVSEVSGAFTDYSGMVTYDPADPDAFQAQATIKAASVDTRNTMRDEHIRGNDYLATDQYPDILFKSRGLNKSDQNYVLVGDLTIRDVTKTIAIPVQIVGPVMNPLSGGEVMGITGETVIDRQDFHVSWNKALDSGGFVLSNEVRLIISLQAKKK